MKMRRMLRVVCLLISLSLQAQVELKANGPENTYEEITAVLAPGYNPIEVPDCGHSSFGRHIDEVFDADLNAFVFRFHIHVTPDDDRCINSDRQRNEIKSYDQSPDNLLGIEDEIVIYKWKFKLDAGLQVSPNFTHVHQLKSVGGSLASMPMYTITLRKGSPDRLELRYAETNSQVTLKQSDLLPFKGVWLEAKETIRYGTAGYYRIEILRVSDNSILFEYENDNIINWRPGADFVRPKWGIYRSLNNAQDLRDEEVLFTDFSVEETTTLTSDDLNLNAIGIKVYPNPSNDTINISSEQENMYDSLEIVNSLGQRVMVHQSDKKVINISRLPKGIYSIILRKNRKKVGSKKLIVN